VVDAFVTKASEVGIDIFRVFDALNDERNFTATFMQFLKKKYGIS
jgi:pyruvate/oxaloacetate carboxyltransferase